MYKKTKPVRCARIVRREPGTRSPISRFSVLFGVFATSARVIFSHLVFVFFFFRFPFLVLPFRFGSSGTVNIVLVVVNNCQRGRIYRTNY